MRRHINTLNGLITLINDDPLAPSPDLPVSSVLAQMIETVVKTTNLSININSTTGGVHSPRSFHYHGQALDINRLDGKRIDDVSNGAAVQVFQQAVAAHVDVAECFGPFINIRKRGAQVEQRPDLRIRHVNHLHISSQT
ncbi:hypothetical protein O4G98_14880 [Zoogloeaceae bacterium G21618-S1]|jgi:hypothetical protein|nr:hypothetical protein [Zoogloeaceae bacterium G21618-S1]